MRSGFRNAEPEVPPGGAKAQRLVHAGRTCGTAVSKNTRCATVSASDRESRVVTTASIVAVLHPGRAVDDTLAVAVVWTAGASPA